MAPGWRDAIRLQWQLTTGRYRGLLVATEARRKECEALLASVRTEELERDPYALDAPLLQDGVVADDGIVAVVDTRSDRVVGVLRATRMSLVARRPELAPDFRFDASLLGDKLDEAFLCHRLAVAPEHRRTAASLVLMRTTYALGVEHRGSLCLLDCEPPIARIYRRLGFHPIGRPYTREGVLFIAMVLVNNDVDHLRRVRSPLLQTWRQMGRPRDPSGRRWAARLRASGQLPSRHFAYVDQDDVTSRLFDGLSPDGRAALITHATRLHLRPGQLIVRGGDLGRWMGIVEDGELEARVDGRRVAVSRPGDLVGEVGFLLGNRRTADIVARGAGATMLVLSPSAVRRMHDPEDRERFSLNIARNLAGRLTAPQQVAPPPRLTLVKG
jgi:predicted GNAT family N-acyltransferase